MALMRVALVVVALWTTGTNAAACDGPGTCCYSDKEDCDGENHWCSKSASECTNCGGMFICATDESKAVKLAAQASKAGKEKETASPSKVSDEPQMLFAMPNAAKITQPVMLASEPSSLAPGRCCYAGAGDCDNTRDWCSKDAGRCERCTGTFTNVTELDLADTTLLAEETGAVLTSGRCCYTGHNDCDGGRDWCSKGEGHCTLCGGTFQGDGEVSPANATQLLAMPLQLEAVAAQASKSSEASRSNDGEQRQQPQQLASESEHGEQGNWQRYIPTEYRHFLKHAAKKDAKASKASEASEASKASAFLSGSSDPVSMPSVAFLSGAGLALLLAIAARLNRRSVTPPTEVLG